MEAERDEKHQRQFGGKKERNIFSVCCKSVSPFPRVIFHLQKCRYIPCWGYITGMGRLTLDEERPTWKVVVAPRNPLETHLLNKS